MGLDMYLRGKRFMSTVFNKDDGPKMEAVQKLFPELEGKKGRFGGHTIQEVIIDAGYWRKANAIHDWFVQTCQGGNDDCGYYYVARDQLLELRQLCEDVLQNKSLAAKLLPTTNGFFFGSTDYDDYYIEDLKSTIQIIDDALTLPENWDFEYHSSW